MSQPYKPDRHSGFDILGRAPCKHGITRFSHCSKCAEEMPIPTKEKTNEQD